jgi:hypothetical protein
MNPHALPLRAAINDRKLETYQIAAKIGGKTLQESPMVAPSPPSASTPSSP